MGYALTPADAEEDPLAQLIGGVGHHDGRVQVAALHEHPEEVGDHKVVVYGGHQTTPRLPQGKDITSASIQSNTTQPPSDAYLVALVDVVVYELQQEPHDVSQDEGGN